MRSKEEIMLYWLIAGIGIVIVLSVEPLVLLVALFAYAIYNLWKHYNTRDLL